jgi:Ca2+-binding RTX toxin-like protein
MPEILFGTPEADTLTATDASVIDGIGGDDTLTGSNLVDLIFGGDDDDSISGLDGNDFLDGARGNDTINTGAGNDLVHAGRGDDNIGGMAGNDTVLAGAGDDLVAWNDPVGDLAFGNAGNDTLLGGNIAADTIFGGNGDDLIRAFATNAAAGTAADFLSGGDGNDIILGGAANDTIDGGLGNDTMSGGGGNNVFEYNGDVVVGQDLVTDFNTAGDVIRLSNFEPDFDPLAALTDGPLGAVLDLGGGDEVTFLGRLAREFDAGDFDLV